MNKNIFLVCITLCITMPGHAGIFDFVSTAVGGVKNLITSGGKVCTPCGTPYNVRCMSPNGTPGDFVPFPINSCFAPLEGGCRPTPELMKNARQYCRDSGQILNEHAASKEETKRDLVNSEISSSTKAINKLLPAATAIGGMALGAVTRDGAVAEAGFQASASLSNSKNDAKSLKNDAKALQLKKEKLQMKQENRSPTTQSGMSQQGMMQPEVNSQEAMQSGMNQQGMMQSGMNQQGMMQPGMVQPETTQPGMVQQWINQPGMTQPGMNQNVTSQDRNAVYGMRSAVNPILSSR